MKKVITWLLLLAVHQKMNAQNIGIGTKAPVEKLHVDGNIKSDTLKPNAIKLPFNAGDGKILTSDAEGNASWQKISKGSSNESNFSVPGNIGYGVWGDCATNGNISEYQPVADTSTNSSLSSFGSSVSIYGNFAIVGNRDDKIGSNFTQGSVSIYQYDGAKWILMQKITDATGAAGDKFGYAVCMTDKYFVVGAVGDDVGANTDQGSFSIYQYNSTSWVLVQKITDAAGAANDYFGVSVSISGNNIIVGSSGDDIGSSIDQGSALFYKYNGTSWVLVQKVYEAVGLTSDFFGHSVSLSGNYAIVGAFYYDVGANSNQGAVTIYKYNGTNWIWMQRISDAYGTAGDAFGCSVSISGNYAIVGANGDDVGANSDQGSASIYQLNGSSWILMEKITDPAGAVVDYFGGNVFISGNYVMIGCTHDDAAAGDNQGSATIYQRVGQGWQRFQCLTDPGGKANENFSAGGLAIHDATKQFLVGVPYYASAGKVVFGKIN